MNDRIQTALTTGASRGLGRALLRALASRGVAVVGVARDAQRLQPSIDELRAQGHRAHGLAVDVAAPGAATRIAIEAADRVGDIDLVIHCASSLGPVPLRPLVDVAEEDLLAVTRTNLVAPLALTRAVVGGMVVRGRGTVVFLSSDAAVEAYAGWRIYGATKAAADHAVRTLGVELGGSGVRVLAVDPGEMDTDMHRDALPDADPATLQRPDDVARRILAAIDDDARGSGARFAAAEVRA